MILKLTALASACLISAAAYGASLEKITTDGGLGNIAFRHLEVNAAGDFVGVSNAKVFAGSIPEKRVGEILSEESTSFVLTASTTFNVDSSTGTTAVTVDVDILSTRLALNSQGDFVLASNARLFVGNARTGQVRQVAAGGSFTDFQVVALNDMGQYVAISAAKIYGGKISDASATLLLAEAVGSFEISDLYGFQNRVDGEVGAKRLALNASGQFVAATRSAVYVGDLAAMTVQAVMQRRAEGFKHVGLNADGQIVVVTGKDVYVGSAD